MPKFCIIRTRDLLSGDLIAIMNGIRPSFTRGLCRLPYQHAQPAAQEWQLRVQMLIAMLGMRPAGLMQRAAPSVCRG